MGNQKFYFIFLICLFFIGFNAYKFGDFDSLKNNNAVEEEKDFFTEGKMLYADSQNSSNLAQNKKYNTNDSNTIYASDAKIITVNQPIPLSGKSKSEIYKIRKNYVMSSVFANKDYVPSEDVFGGIVSGKPWISADVCIDTATNHLKITGPSEESRFINNPTMLVAIEYPYPVRYSDTKTCTGYNFEMIPKEITYSQSKKEITVKYYHLPFTTNNNPSFYMFNGVNARDLGYKYAYIDNSKSTYKVNFIHPDNISTDVKEFQNFIHLGSSCGQEGGCNNGSPRQAFLEFKSNETSYNYKYREIYIKLWKSLPKSSSEKPDMVERIILEWS